MSEIIAAVGKKTQNVRTVNPCLCGCKKPTKSRFAPGHDAKLKSVLQTAFRNGGLSPLQQQQVDSLNWSRFMTSLPAKVRKDKKAPATTGVKPAKRLLTDPQVTILTVLDRNIKGLTKKQIQEKAKISMNMTRHLGPAYREDLVKESESKRSLLGLGYVSCKVSDPDQSAWSDSTVWFINGNGKKALSKALNSK